MNELRTQAETWLQAAEPAAVVTVTRAQGSTPRIAGTRMLVTGSRLAGTIGGGHLELQSVRMAREMLRRPGFEPFSRRFALGPSLGQCCGGAVEVRVEPLTQHSLHEWPADAPRFHLYLYGAGHVGHALVRALAPISCVVDWIDSREPAFEELALGAFGAVHEFPSHVRTVISDAPEDESKHAPADAFHLVMTHDHDLDLRICRAILTRNQFGFLGLIGSSTKHVRFVRRLRDYGVAAELVDRMISPIGVPGITGKEPEVIAASVAAQLLLLSSR